MDSRQTKRVADFKHELQVQLAILGEALPEDKVDTLLEAFGLALQSAVFSGKNPEIPGLGTFVVDWGDYKKFRVDFVPDKKFTSVVGESWRRKFTRTPRKETFHDAREYTRQRVRLASEQASESKDEKSEPGTAPHT